MTEEQNMQAKAPSNQSPLSETSPSGSPAEKESPFDPRRMTGFSGYVLVASAAFVIIILTTILLTKAKEIAPLKEGQNALAWTMQNFGNPIFLLISAMILGGLGIRLLTAAGKGVSSIIPPQDRELLSPLIAGGNETGIKLYVILSSLSGFTGTFQKIGFTGLPLATVSLTMVFSVLSFYNAAFLDLAKLTLGAFIGSFVQKGQEEKAKEALK